MTAPIHKILKRLSVVIDYQRFSPTVTLNYLLSKLARTDEMTLSDTATMNIGSGLTDTVLFVEEVDVGVTKPVIEIAVVTSDVVSLALQKTFTESISVSELLTSVAGLGATPTDSTALTDVLTVAYTKALTENITLSENLTRLFNDSLLEDATVNVLDTVAVTSTANKTDTVTMSEEVLVSMVYAIDVDYTRLVGGSAMNSLALN